MAVGNGHARGENPKKIEITYEEYEEYKGLKEINENFLEVTLRLDEKIDRSNDLSQQALDISNMVASRIVGSENMKTRGLVDDFADMKKDNERRDKKLNRVVLWNRWLTGLAAGFMVALQIVDIFKK